MALKSEKCDLTTKQLGEAIAQAVLWEFHKGDPGLESITETIFAQMQQHHVWFCRVREDPVKGTQLEQMEMFK